MLHAMRIGAGVLGADPVDFLVWTPVPLLFGGLSPRRDPHHHRHRRTDRAGHQPHPRTRSRWHSGGRLRHRDGLGIQLLRKVDFHQQSNRVIAAVALAVGAAAHPHPRLLRQVPGRRPHPAGQRGRGGAFTAAFLNFVFHHLGAARRPADGDITQIKHDEHHHPMAAPLEDQAGRRGVQKPSGDSASHSGGVATRGAGPGPMTDFDHTDLDRDELLLEPGVDAAAGRPRSSTTPSSSATASTWTSARARPWTEPPPAPHPGSAWTTRCSCRASSTRTTT